MSQRRGGETTNASPSGYHLATAAPFFLVVSLLTLSGCAVGPDFKKPAPPDVSGYTQQPLATIGSVDAPGGDAQRFDIGKDISGDWWTVFHSKPLNLLVDEALKNNSDLKAAQAALNSSRESVLAQRGAFFPSVSAGISATREQDPSGALAPVPSNNAFEYSLFTPQLSVSYVPDVFGLNRRSVESLRAQEQAVRFQTTAVRTTLAANVVVGAIQQAALRAQIAATHELIDSGTKALEILQLQFSKGVASKLDLAAQESQLAQIKATLPPLRKQLAQQDHQLAALAGAFPSQNAVGAFDLADLQLPREVPVSLPAQLVAQRPDVLQAQANLHAASAQVGVAIASRLPQIELSANAGSTALAIDQVFHAGTGFWSVGLDLAAPIFQGGKLRHAERAAKATYAQAAAQYRSTVLTAFENVADVLTALQQDASALQSAATAVDAAQTTLDLSQRQWHAGYASYLAVLSAAQSYQQARIALIQAQANRFADTAALYLALGGGWWHQATVSGNAHEN
jgi:NodT family efflux transporter outer membrane factor (OMF) lipoprotein